MPEAEFLGEELSEWPVELQMYPKQSVKRASGPDMWHTVYSSLHEHVHEKGFFLVQLARRMNIRVGIKYTPSTHTWLTQVKYEPETLGFNTKNEPTREQISNFLDGSD